MANKIILYNLTSQGNTPSFIEHGGLFAKANNNASPQDLDIIGATVDGSSEEGLGVFANQAAVETYLDSFISSWPIGNGDTNAGDTNTIEVLHTANGETPLGSNAAAAAYIWTKKIN